MNGKQEIKRVYPPLKMIIVFEILYFIYIYTLVFIKVDIQKYIFLFFFPRNKRKNQKIYIFPIRQPFWKRVYIFEHVSIGIRIEKQKIVRRCRKEAKFEIKCWQANLVIVWNVIALQYALKQRRLSIFLANRLCTAWSIYLFIFLISKSYFGRSMSKGRTIRAKYKKNIRAREN